MTANYTTVEEQVEYGLDKIDPERKIELSLRNFLFLHNTVEELIRFFHQPIHYETLVDVERFLGSKDRGALHLLWQIAYEKFYYRDVLPADIQQMIDDGEFENPDSPYYFQPS